MHLLVLWPLLLARAVAGSSSSDGGASDRQTRVQLGELRLRPGDQRLLDALLEADAEVNQRSYGSVTSKIPFRQWTHQSGQLLPTCAPQQVCNTVYPRLQRTNPRCVCPRGFSPCSPILRNDDGHTVQLVTDKTLGALTAVKTCEANQEIRECATDDDWSLLAVQNTRSGKSHFLVICRCPADGSLEGPAQHAQPHYAHLPTIRIYGMLCRRRPHHKHHHRYRRHTQPGHPTGGSEEPLTQQLTGAVVPVHSAELDRWL